MAQEQVQGTMRISMENETDKLPGKFIILWRKEEKQAARIEKVDTEAKFIYYELISGPEKGKRFKSRFDSSQKGIDVFDDDSVILAVLST